MNSSLKSIDDDAKLKGYFSWSILVVVAIVYILNTFSSVFYELIFWAVFLFVCLFHLIVCLQGDPTSPF